MTPALLLTACNAARQRNRLRALSASAALDQAAQELADRIARTGSLSHADFAGRLQRSGYRFRAVAENAALCGSPDEAVSMWLRSAGHRRNLLGGYVHAGCGVRSGRRGTAFVLTVAVPW
jgi:uncharacterized protein YkwD